MVTLWSFAVVVAVATTLSSLPHFAAAFALSYRHQGRQIPKTPFVTALKLQSNVMIASNSTTISPSQTEPDDEMRAAMKCVAPLLADIENLQAVLARCHSSVDEQEHSADLLLQDAFFKVSRHLETSLNDLFGSNSFLEDEPTRSYIQDVVRSELGPILHEGQALDRSIRKPRGYAGDFLTIDMIYDNQATGIGRIRRFGELVDRAFLDLKGAQAVRNRRIVITDEIRAAVKSKSTPLQVTSMGCGPARELQDVFFDGTSEAYPNIHCHLIDIDGDALEFVRCWVEEIPDFPHHQVTLNQKNLLRLARDRDSLDLPRQDIIYSAGLIDYLKDDTVVRLLNYAYDNLKPGGKVMLGNFHKNNPTRGLLDSVVEWYLIHRDEDEMNEMFQRSKFGTPCSEILFDDTGVQMFACCVKKEHDG